MKIVYSRIKDLRLKEKHSQNDIAKLLNVCQSTYSKWKSGNEMIPLEKLFTLSIFYKKSMNYITGLSGKGAKKILVN